MPQKKNPDVAELVRGRAGRVYGALMSTLTTLKGLPLAYNRDLQEDKEPLFQAVKTTRASLDAMAGLVGSLRFNTDRLACVAEDDSLLATDLAHHLVRQGAPFSEAHAAVGRLVLEAEQSGKTLSQFSLEELRRVDSRFTEAATSLSARDSVDSRDVVGGTGSGRVREAAGRSAAAHGRRMTTIKIAPSLLAADFARLGDQVAEAEQGGAELLHVDIMDGHFVPPVNLGLATMEAINASTELFLDVHLMVSRPDHLLQPFVEAGADSLTVHLEATDHIHRLVSEIHNLGVRAGVGVNPGRRH